MPDAAGSQALFASGENGNNKAFTSRDIRGTSKLGDSMLLRINVGGASYRLRVCSILQLPKSRLARICDEECDQSRLGNADGYLEESDEYFFERPPFMFEHLMLAYRTQEVHMPEVMCPRAFVAEMEYWMLDRSLVPECCADALTKVESSNCHHSMSRVPKTMGPSCSNNLAVPASTPAADNRAQKNDYTSAPAAELSKTESSTDDQLVSARNDLADSMKYSYVRRATWQFLEVPSSSIGALVFMVVSCMFIMLTVIVLLLGSIEDFQVVDPVTNTTDAMLELEIADTVSVVWFTLEYILRLWAAPERMEYVKTALSIIDLLACAPFYLEQTFSMFGVNSKTFADFRRSLVPIRILRVMRVLRVLRVLKVARYSRGFQSMGQTLIRSWRELVMLILFTLTTNFIFSTALLFLEADVEGSMFHNIPQAAWLCVITMTTVGYGDVYPVTVAGKLLAGFVSISGILLLAFPISVIVENFYQEYYPQGNHNDNENEQSLVKTVNSVLVIDGIIYVEVTSRPAPKKRRAHLKAF